MGTRIIEHYNEPQNNESQKSPGKAEKQDIKPGELIAGQLNKLKDLQENAKKFPLEKTMESLRKNKEYFRSMSDEEFEALKSSLASLVGVKASEIVQLTYDIDPRGNRIELYTKYSSVIIDTAENVVVATRYSFTGPKKEIKVPFDDPAVKKVLENGGTLFDYIERPEAK